LSMISVIAGFWAQARNEASKRKEPSPIRKDLIWFVSIPLMTLLLMCASIAPYEYAISSFPDARVLVTIVYVFFLSVVAWSFLIGTLISRLNGAVFAWIGRFAWITAVVCLGLFFVYTRKAVLLAGQDRDVMRNYATAWDERDRKLRLAAEDNSETVYAASLPHMGGGLAEIGFDPEEWINRCVALTYGIDQVIAK